MAVLQFLGLRRARRLDASRALAQLFRAVFSVGIPRDWSYTGEVVANALNEMLERRLSHLAQAGLLRERHANTRRDVEDAARRQGRRFLDLSSNDYLGLAAMPAGDSALAGGAGASRLIHGTRAPHQTLESALATWLGTEDALLFSSGYAANVGLVSAAAQPGDLVVSDALNHASLIDGCRLSRAEVVVVPHRDLAAIRRHLEAAGNRTVWVVSEAYFSMDGTACNVAALGELLRGFPRAHLLLDEAHSLGIFGPSGRGLAASAGYRPAALVGTFGKAFGLQGAFVAGSSALCAWLWNRARSFIYSTATSPTLAGALVERLQLVSAADDRRAALQALAASFHVKLEHHFPGAQPADTFGPIAPLLLGDERLAVDVAQQLGQRGILTQAIRPPTVAPGTARLRMTLGTHLSEADLGSVIEALLDSIPNPVRR